MEIDKQQQSTTSTRPAPTGQDSEPTDNTTGKASNFDKDLYSKEARLGETRKEITMERLGFEPDGSATKPSYCEGYQSLHNLLCDPNGYKLFYEYVQLSEHESLLEFWRSCEEFRRLGKTGSNLTTRSANSIYNNFMHKRQLCGEILSDTIRAKVKHKLNSGQVPSETTFDSAQEAILAYISEVHYPKFLRWDVYKRLVEPVKSRERRINRYAGTPLEPLFEEKVLAFDSEQQQGSWLYETSRSRSRALDNDAEGYLLQSQNLSKAVLAAMYTQPAPVVSVNDSDVQSLSSDALTDDAKSTVTDFSDLASKSLEKKQGVDIQGFLPRTKRLPKGRKPLSPEDFAKILCEKLEKVLIQREQEERAAVNLASLPRDLSKENKREKSILEDAAERHHQFQQAGRFGIPPHKYTDPCYSLQGNTSILSSSCPSGYIEPCQIVPPGYYPGSEHCDKWRGLQENVMEKPQCVPLMNTKKQRESVGTLEKAPDNIVNMEEEHTLPPEARNRILQWMEQGEKNSPQIQHSNFPKNTRIKHAALVNTSRPNLPEPGIQHLRPIVQDPLMPPLPQPDPTNTIEEVSRRLAQKSHREKRNKIHHKNRPGYVSSRSSQMTCPPQYVTDSSDCATSVISGDYHPAIYSSSSILSSIDSGDSGLGLAQKKSKKTVESTKIVYYLPGEEVPYRLKLPDRVSVTLGQFKELMNLKKGNYRYFFKIKTHDVGEVFDDISDDTATLPCFGDKIICKVREV